MIQNFKIGLKQTDILGIYPKKALLDIDDMPYEKLENLVNNIREKTGLNFGIAIGQM